MSLWNGLLALVCKALISVVLKSECASAHQEDLLKHRLLCPKGSAKFPSHVDALNTTCRTNHSPYLLSYLLGSNTGGSLISK